MVFSELVAGADLAATDSAGFTLGAGAIHKAAINNVTAPRVVAAEIAVEQRATIFPD
jgi:hypothetical protein